MARTLTRGSGRYGRRSFLAGGTGAAVWLLAACAPAMQAGTPAPKAQAPGEAAPKAAPKPDAGGKTTLRFWHQMGAGPGRETTEKMAQEYAEKNATIAVETTYVAPTGQTQASEKLMAAIAGGTPPEIYRFDRFLTASWAARDALTELTDLARRDNIKKEDFFPFAWAESSYCNKLYSMPFDTDGRNLYWNKAHFKAAGLDADKPPRTWSEADQYAEKLTVKQGTRVSQIGFVPWRSGGLSSWAMTLKSAQMWDFEKARCPVNSSEWIKTAEWFVAYADKYDIAALDSFTGAFGTQTQDPMCMGQLSMVHYGSWMMAQLNQYCPQVDYGVALLPSPDGPSTRNMAGGWSWVIPKGVAADRMEPTWAFLKYMSSTDAAILYGKRHGNWPTRVDALKDPFWRQDPKRAVFIDTLPDQWNRPSIPEGQLLATELTKAQDLIIHKKLAPKEALDNVAKAVDDAMAKWKC